MRLSLVDLLVAALLVALLATALARCARHPPGGAGAVRASWTLTPGVLNPAVTQATIRTTVCVRGWTGTVRPPVEYTNALKRRQLRALGLPGPLSRYQEDHLISLSLGGHPSDPRNLWPEPRPRAEEVDKIELDLHEQVCGGSLTLAEAQRRETNLKHRDG